MNARSVSLLSLFAVLGLQSARSDGSTATTNSSSRGPERLAAEATMAMKNVERDGLSDVGRSLWVIELLCRDAPTDVRLDGMAAFIRIGGAVLARRDRSVDPTRVIATWPTFDAVAMGAKHPVFAGASPESIADPRIRVAYERALADHHAESVKVVTERKKVRVARDAFCEARIIMRAVGTEDAKKRARSAIQDLPSSALVAEAMAMMFPADVPSEE